MKRPSPARHVAGRERHAASAAEQPASWKASSGPVRTSASARDLPPATGGSDWISTWSPDGEEEDRYRSISTPSIPPSAAGVPNAEAVRRVDCPSIVDVASRHVTRVVIDLTLEDDGNHVTCDSEHGADALSIIGLTDESDTGPSSTSASDVLFDDPTSRRWRGWASGPRATE